MAGISVPGAVRWDALMVQGPANINREFLSFTLGQAQDAGFVSNTNTQQLISAAKPS